MDKLKKLMETRAAKVAEMDKLLSTAEASESGEMTQENRSAFDALKSEVDAIDTKISDLQTVSDAQRRAADLERSLQNSVHPAPQPQENREVDFSKFSFTKAIRQLKRGQLDGFEAECNQEGYKESRAAGVSFNDNALILPRALIIASGESRAMAAGTDSAGGVLVPTDTPRSIFDIFQNAQVLSTLGATLWDGLSGDVPLPKLTADITATATGETTQISASSPTFSAEKLTPQRIGAVVEVSNQLLLQNSVSVQSWVTNKLVSAVLVKLQDLIINGSASDAITGILATTGVTTTDASSAAPTFAKFAQMIKGIVGKDVDRSKLAYLINSATEAYAISTPKVSGTGSAMIMSDALNADGTHSICGYRAATSDVLPANGTTGSGESAVTGLSKAIFGKWDDIIAGQWGGIGLINDPLTKADAGQTRLIVESFFDAVVVRPSSFNVMTNALC